MPSSLLQFEKDIVDSFTKGQYYSRITKKPLSYSLKFFATFSFFYAAIAIIYVWLKFLLPISPVIQTLPSRLAQIYPQELEIIIQEGVVYTNVPEPYFINIHRLEKVIYQIRDDILGAASGGLDHLLVIDTQAQISDFYLYKTFALLTKDHFVYLSRSSSQVPYQIRAINIDESTNMQINKSSINAFAKYLEQYSYKAPVFLIIIFFLFLLLFLPIIRLAHASLISLIVFIINRLIHTNYSYKQIFQISLHTFIVAIIITGTVTISLGQSPTPLTTTVITLVTSALVLIYKKKHIHAKAKKINKTKSP